MTKKDKIEKVLDDFVTGHRWQFIEMDKPATIDEILKLCNNPRKLSTEKLSKLVFVGGECSIEWINVLIEQGEDIWENIE